MIYGIIYIVVSISILGWVGNSLVYDYIKTDKKYKNFRVYLLLASLIPFLSSVSMVIISISIDIKRELK